MKRYIALTIALLATATAGFAQSANLTISGTVAAVASISVATATGYNSLDIVNGEPGRKVADVTERCNKKNGYTVKMTSLNAGASGNSLFLADATTTDTVPYSLTYNGNTVSFASGTATLTDANAKTGKDGVVKPLTVTISSSWVDTGAYADTLTLTIASK